MVKTIIKFERFIFRFSSFIKLLASLFLSGDVGGHDIQIRESPTLASLGETYIMDIGGGLYDIDSFFDVFTELSVDGGP